MSKVKILQMNVWNGRIKDGLTRFITEGDYDVICMQEAIWDKNNTGFLELYVDTVEKIKKAGGFKYDFRSPYFGIKALSGDVIVENGIVILSKIPFKKTEEKIVLSAHKITDSADNFKEIISGHGYPAQKVVLENGLVIVNYHGYWLKNPLGDKTTVACMRKVADMIRDESRPTVMCGDLNIVSKAKAMRELNFLTDLTAKNHLKTTLRNIRFVKKVACDHILVSKNVSYEKFKSIDTIASDHKALSINVSI